MLKLTLPIIFNGKATNLDFSPEQARVLYNQLHKIYGQPIPVVQNNPQSYNPPWGTQVTIGSMLN